MTQASPKRPLYADQHPDFYKMVTSNLGELLHVDEFDVPYWSGYPDHVFLKASHPMFKSERKITHVVNELNALDKILKQFDEINAREQEQCPLESERSFLLKQSRPFKITFYEEAKSIFMSAQKITPS